MDYILHILIMLNIYVILSVSSSLVVGLANLLSLGQAAFYGIGAYISVFALMQWGLPFFPAIILAILGTYLFSYVISLIAIRFKEDYFVLVTLGFQIIIYTILYNWIDVTRGPYGIAGIPSPKIFNLITIDGTFAFFILSSFLSVGTVFIFYKLIHAPFGRALRALDDNELALINQGRNTRKLKTNAFTLSGCFAAVSGFIYATYISYIDPTSFNLDESIFILTAILIGGTGNVKGPVLGAVFVVVLPEILRFVGIPDSIAANLRMIIYGLSIILLMLYRPQGIAGLKKYDD